ncbi:MAG TPA: hypothetical protein VFQ67_05260 [Allosphingosinicella sp.]|jgi:hypothetical protein|nr:hypothetical protein [Allosphingosinicella sp.]
MILLRYNAAKLLIAAGALLFLLVPLVLIFLYPEEPGHLRGGFIRLLSAGLGHDVVLPVLIGACLMLMGRCAATALGDGVAIEAKGDSIHVTDIWGTRRIAWAQLAPLQIERTSRYGSTNHRLIFRGGGRAAKVPVGLTELADDALPGLVARIETMRYASARPEAPREQRAFAPAGPAGFGRKRS